MNGLDSGSAFRISLQPDWQIGNGFFSNNNNNNNNNSNKEREKIEKYLDFKKELKRLWNCKEVVLVSIVIGALGTVSKGFRLYLTKAGLDGSILPLQKAYLLGTAKDYKRGFKEV